VCSKMSSSDWYSA